MDNQPEKKGLPVILYGLIVALMPALLMIALFFNAVQNHFRSTGENVGVSPSGGSAVSGSGGVDCSGVENVKAEYLPWIQQSSKTWLKGDEAALIALIHTESNWDERAYNPSGATGLGQFVYGTATGIWNGKKKGRGMPEFIGGNDTRGTDWSAGQVTAPPGDNDARYDPKRSIFASAHLFGLALELHKGDLRKTYIESYHTYANAAQKAEAEKGAARMMDAYNNLIKNDGCKQTSSSAASIDSLPSALGERIVATAKKYIGTKTTIPPGSSENVFRCDAPTRSCASFVSWVLNEAGATQVFEGSTTGLWRNAGGAIVIDRGGALDLGKLKPGDVVWFGDGSRASYKGALFNHVGIYVGNGLIVDTSSSSQSVVGPRSITTHKGSNRFMAAKRFGL